jgi:glycosyltransferase involved in cell wall biosynthesis
VNRGPGFRSVVHVNEKGGRFGGTEEYIDLITSELAGHGVRSHLVCGGVFGDLPATMDSTSVVDGLASRVPTVGGAAAVAAVVASLDADVVYLHNLFDPALVTELAANEQRGVLIWYVHDHYLTCLSELRWRRDHGACRERLGEGCLAAIEQGHCVLRYPELRLGDDELRDRRALSDTLSLVDDVIVVSGYMRDLLVDARPDLAERIHHVHRPIRDIGIAPTRSRDATDPAIITFAGRIVPEKGLAVLIEALASIGSTAAVELRVAGVIEHLGYWEHCQRLQLRAMALNPNLQISALGHLDYAATDELLRQSDIVAIPSQWPEPLGSVALEAMSAGAAVIASDIGGLAGTISHGDNGLLVAPGATGAWTAAIDILLDHPEQARRLGQRGHRQARRHTISDHLDVLDHIVQARTCAPRTVLRATVPVRL